MDAPARIATFDLGGLIARLEQGVAGTSGKFRSQGTLIVIGAVVVAGICAARGIWFLVPVCLLFGAGIFALSRVAARNTSASKVAPVLTALRDSPDRVRSIRHMITSDTRRMFTTHWIEVRTSDARLAVRADDDWRDLLDALAKHCPSAKVDRGRAAN